MPSGFSGRHADGESGSPSSSSSGSLALGSAAIRGQAEVARDPAPLLRGFRKPATGEWRGTHFSAWTEGPCRPREKLKSALLRLPVCFYFSVGPRWFLPRVLVIPCIALVCSTKSSLWAEMAPHDPLYVPKGPACACLDIA